MLTTTKDTEIASPFIKIKADKVPGLSKVGNLLIGLAKKQYGASPQGKRPYCFEATALHAAAA
ncbi:hypothetical protein SAMN02745170_03010 [Propionispora hippei DSM 15287]|uniref:Uncharacterized protein n=1 Tax=Propionispora hippei DSM 15287 TaxID=1123003 RepID=A0A1M6L2H5_9FIRM|nr:hypothetical protein SAMN02745170_03010 [Propionispora hippei DSM 15287]